jgi:hypothetical protein
MQLGCFQAAIVASFPRLRGAPSSAKLRYLSWAFYKGNQPEHPIHSLPIHMVSRIWDILKTRKLEIWGQIGQNPRQPVAVAATAKRRAVSGGHALAAAA